MKKLTAILLSFVLLLGLAACGSTAPSAPAATAVPTVEPAVEPTEEPAGEGTEQPEDTGTEMPAEGSKTLVVYFSATGSTRRVAETIADALSADTFELVLAEPYTGDELNYNDASSRVSREHADESLRDVALTTTEVPDWDSYDTVFIGYPIWWGIAAWPVNGFVAANDFTGKTVIPFATSASSGMGQSAPILEALTNTGTWQEGRRFSSGTSESTVQEWVNGLGR